jgi:hypothetical protein
MADIRTPSTLEVARSAVARLGSIAAAAAVCSAAGFRVSRPNLSRYLGNTLDSVANIETAILACFDRHACPYLGMEIDSGHCQEVNTGPVPTWDPAALDQRRCCQTCPHKPDTKPGEMR